MTSKHTPGPWTVENDELVMPFDIHSRRPVCNIADLSPDDATLEEARANVSLIAAAPELLEALKNLHEMTAHALPHVSPEWSRRGAPDGNHMEMSVAMENARTAITKAKGQS